MDSKIITDLAGRKIDLTSPAYLTAALKRLRERTRASK